METLRRVAFVCPRMTNSFTRMVWYSLQDAARVLGVRLTAVMGGPLDHPRNLVPSSRVYGLLDPRNFDGAVLYTGALSYFPVPGSMDSFVRSLDRLPLVSLGLPLEGVDSVAADQGAAVKTLVHHLYEVHGIRKFCLVTGPLSQVEPRIRRGAFFEALGELGVPNADIREFTGDYSRTSGAEAVRSLKPALREPTALVCTNDEEAIGALEAAKELGIPVPGLLAVTGFDDIEMAVNQEPGVTTVELPLLLLARRALGMLVKKMDGQPVSSPEILEPLFYYRGSCGCGPRSAEVPKSPGQDAVLAGLLATQENVTEGYREFITTWTRSFLESFGRFLDTGNSRELKDLWAEYFQQLGTEQERGLPLRQLFTGLEDLYSGHPAFPGASRENLILAGTAESYKGVLTDQMVRNFYFQLHTVELEVLRVNDRAGLADLSFQGLVQLGVTGLALVRSGVTPALLYFRTLWTEGADPSDLGPIEYPALLPASLAGLDQPSHRIVVALSAENLYLGYAVFWVRTREAFVCDFLANQFSGALQRLELMDRVREQRESLQESLEASDRMREQLVETEKVASLGRLVAGVAHEINTPLGTGITGTSFLLDRLGEVRNQFEAGTLGKTALAQFLTTGKEALTGVLRNLMKAGELIQAFKGLGLDHGQGEWKPVEVRNLFEDLDVLYTGELAKRGIILKSDLPSRDLLIYSQPSALVQVAGELLENAMDHAFPPGFDREPQVLLQVSVADDTLKLAVTDNGRGLEPDERRHIFDPLFTTRRTEGHAGLGLHLAFQLVSRTLGGQMTVASEPGAGSCFLCSIPLKLE